MTYFYHARSSQRNKKGRTAYDSRVRMEADAKMTNTHDAFVREITKINEHTRTAKYRPGGEVPYATRCRQISTCYNGRLLAEGVALSKAPRAIRAIAYSDLDLRDWCVSMAYFTFASHAVGKLMIDQDIPYFRLEAAKAYILSKETVYESMMNMRGLQRPVARLRAAMSLTAARYVLDTKATSTCVDLLVRKTNLFYAPFSCWSFASHVSGGESYRVASNDVGPKVVRSTCMGGEEKSGRRGVRAVIFPGQVEARAMDAFSPHHVAICKTGPGRVLDRIIIHFDGAEVIADSFPPDFKDSASSAIATDTGFVVCLSEKRHFFAGDEVGISAISANRSLDPPAGSILNEPVNCVIIALYRVRADKDFLGVYETVARNRPIGGGK